MTNQHDFDNSGVPVYGPADSSFAYTLWATADTDHAYTGGDGQVRFSDQHWQVWHGTVLIRTNMPKADACAMVDFPPVPQCLVCHTEITGDDDVCGPCGARLLLG